MNYETITTAKQLKKFCEELADAKAIALDTEFVAEHTYRPKLCLLQVAVGDRLLIVDTMEVTDIGPFWQQIVDGGQQTIVHAGREEIGFCLRTVGAVPNNLFDLQIAAGLTGLEFPAGYASLAQRLLGVSPGKGETRTDWRRRPLSQQQLKYALNDVLYLQPMRDKLVEQLTELGRLDWLQTETDAWVEEIQAAHRRENWRRVSGMSGLSPRSKAVVRELWRWREAEAERRDMPPRRVLRDDLIVEIAKRRIADEKHIRAVRGVDRPDLRKAMPQLAECVKRALSLRDDEMPRSQHRRKLPPQLNMLGQFLSSALATICRRANLAPSIVGNPSDVRELIAYRLGYYHEGDPAPVLTQGWRAKVVGELIDDLLAGKMAIRITDPESEHPFAFESLDPI